MTYCKIKISGDIEIRTGMHIGASKEYSAIGTVDSPVVYDPLSKLPLIPGSSLKGKLRYLLVRKYNDNLSEDPNNDNIKIRRLFGSSKKGDMHKSRVLILDSIMTEEERDRLLSLGVEGVTEIKFENSINRITGISNPRQIERVIKGALFPLEIIYELTDEEEALEDIKNLKEAFDLLENDYIGGNGSRGYGRVKFINMNLSQLTYDCSEELLDKLKEMWFHE